MAIELQQIFDSGEISQPSGGVLPPSLNAGTFFVLNTVSGPVLYVGSAANLPVQVTQTMALENGKLLVGNSLGIATPVNISGDATVANNGLLTISNLAVNTAKIADSAVTYSKIQNVTGNTLLGRSGTAGVVQELSPVAIRSLINVADGANNYVHPNHTGDVTSTGDGATVIANNAVTDAKLRDSVGYSVIGKSGQTTGDPQDIVAGADSVLRRSGTGTLTFGTLVTNHYGDNSVTLGKMATLAASTILGRASGAGTGNVTALTAAQVRTILNVADGAQVNTVTSVAGKTGAVTLVSSDVGLGNVTNDAQVKKTASATVVGNIPTWASVTGDLLSGGYEVETVLVGDPQALATAEAIKDYVDSLLASNDAMVFKGTLGTGGTVTSLPLTHSAGWTYRVITAGTYAGQVAEVGDLFVAIIDRSGSGNLNSDWTLLQTNIDGAVVGPASSTNDHVALFDGTSGKLLKSAGVVLGNGTLTLNTSGIATGSASFSANQTGNVTFTVAVPATNLAEASRTTTSVQITSSTGTAATLSSATTSLAGLMSSADKTKLDGIAAGAQVGTVTSVSGTGTVSGLTLSGTVTSSGNITLGGTLSVTPSNFSSQTANTFLAAPNGSAGTPTFRAIVAADIPTLNQNTTGTSAGVIRTVTGTNTAELVRGNMADNDQFRILVGGTATNAGYVEIATADDGTEPIHVRQYTGVFTTLVRTATLLDASGNTSFPGTVTAPTFSGALSGNASTATTLQTARTINGVSFNGSANITVTANTTNTIIFNNGGAGESSGASFDGSVQRTISYNTFGAAAASGVNATGTWPISISGVAASVTDGMYLSTNQNVTGTKTFVNGLTVGASNLAPSLSGITFSYEDLTPGSSTTKLIANDYGLGTITVTLPAASGELALVSQIPSVGTGVLTLAVSGVGLSGSATFNANQSTNTTFTVTSNATSSNNANTIVSRDASGNFSAGTITASLTGNASTASTLQTARTLTIGSTGKTFNGSANVTWSLAEIGAAATSHTHAASDITSGDITPRIPWAATNAELNGNYVGIGNGSATVIGAGESRGRWEATYTSGNRDAETLWLLSDDNVIIRVNLQTNWASGINALTIANTGVATFANTVNATTFSGALSGNATTATTLQTARTINGVSFNGSANITITANTTNAITFNDAGSGVGSGTTFDGSVARTISYNTIGAAAANGTNAAGTWGISITGNAATATNTINWKANNSSGVLQVTGPGTGTTRVMTAPDSNFTVARTDSSQTFTGTQTFSSTISGSINGNAATVTDGVYLSGTQTVTGAKTLEDITIGGSLKTIKYGSVLSITLPAQGTRAAFLNVGVNSVVVVRISSSENAFYQPIELTIARNGTGSTITIHKDNPFFHEHSDDVAFSANTATGDIYAEKILYSTGRNFRIHAVEILFGTATVLNGSLTTTGVPDQSITRLGRSIYVSGSAATINGVLTSGVSTGTAPFVVSSTTRVSNLNVATAGTADTLTTARTINGVSFNGSANITITANTPNSLTFNNSGSGASSGSTFNGGSAITVSYNTIGAPSTTGANASGTWGISITGNAATVTNGVYTTGNQSIAGLKTFESAITVGTTAQNPSLTGIVFSYEDAALGLSSTKLIANEYAGGTTTLITLPATSGELALTSQLPSVGDGTLTLAVSGVGLAGSASFTANQSGNATFTVTSNATSANTASTIVARDASGNFVAGTITAALSGNASTATALQNSRTLWGQNFNGTANVTGALSSVTTISMSGQLTSTLATGTAPFVVTSTTRVANLNVATSGTADQLTTARNIGGTSFNGTANIEIIQIKSNSTSGLLQITGPAAASTRIMTTPDANFTVARTDAAQTFTGTQTFSSTISGSITGNAGTVTNGVYTTGDQSIAGNKTLTGTTNIRTLSIASLTRYHYSWGGAQDLTWKRIARFSSTATDGYRGASGVIIVHNENSNYGVALRTDHEARFWIRYSDNSVPADTATIQVSPGADSFIRLQKLGTRDYELQVRQAVDWRIMGAIFELDHNNGDTITIEASGTPPTGNAGVSTVTSTALADAINISGSAATLTTTRTLWGQNFNGSANVTGSLSSVTTISMSGQLTNTVSTGTAPFVVSSTTRVANLNVATAGTADTLTTSRTINGEFFNGSANINVSSLRGSNGTTTIATTGVASALNRLTVTNSATGNPIIISTDGDDTNIGLTITTKGTGSVIIDTGTGLGDIDIKPGTANLRVWDDDSTHYYRFVTGNRAANYDINLPAGNVTLVTGTMVPTSVTLTIANGTGITGGGAAVDLSANRSWTIGLTGQALAMHNLATTGIIARTGADTFATRTITGTTNQINVSNGDGVSGSPVLSLPQDIHTGATPTFSTLSLSGGLVTVGQSGTLGSIVIWTEDGVSTPATLTVGVSGSGAAGNHTVNFKRENGTVALLTDIPTVNNGTLTLNVSGTGLSGSTTFSANQSGNATFTVTSNATSANTASTIVARDASGNFSAGTITAALTGNSSTATALQNIRTIWGQNFNGTANVTGALSSVTTLSMSGQLTNTVATGTAPLVISSTTRVANLNVATAGTADQLTTTRTINGTNFNGTANITTANWGTSRTLTIGNTGKSVNGSANVTWSLAEIGAKTAGDTGNGFVEYNTTTRAAGKFYGGTTDPISTTRLNYDGVINAMGGVFKGLTLRPKFISDLETSYTVTTEDSLIFCNDIAGNGVQITLPASPRDGQMVIVRDVAGMFGTIPSTFLRNGKLINGNAANLSTAGDNSLWILVYSADTGSWHTNTIY